MSILTEIIQEGSVIPRYESGCIRLSPSHPLTFKIINKYEYFSDVSIFFSSELKGIFRVNPKSEMDINMFKTRYGTIKEFFWPKNVQDETNKSGTISLYYKCFKKNNEEHDYPPTQAKLSDSDVFYHEFYPKRTYNFVKLECIPVRRCLVKRQLRLSSIDEQVE